MTKNKNNYNDQYNDAIDNDLTLDNISFNLSSGNKDPLPLVTVSFRGVKKHRSTLVAGLIYVWDSGATNSMIKGRHTKHY